MIYNIDDHNIWKICTRNLYLFRNDNWIDTKISDLISNPILTPVSHLMTTKFFM